MAAARDLTDERRLGLRLWQSVDYLFWLPLGTRPEAIRELRDLRVERLGYIHALEKDPDRGRLSSWQLFLWAIRGLPETGGRVLDIVGEFGADVRWVYRVADPVMVFGLLPILFVLSGFALGGGAGIALSFGLLLLIWSRLVIRLRLSMRNPEEHHPAPAHAFLTLPNALTLGRLVALCFIPMLFEDGHPIRVLVYFAAIASTDWADGFVARHYNLQTRIGTMLDPATDRFLMIVVFAVLITHHRLAVTLGVLILGRELLASILTLVFFRPKTRQGNPRVEVHWIGKLGFALNSVAVVVILSAPPLPMIVRQLAELLMIVALILNVYVLVLYMQQALTAPDSPIDDTPMVG